MSLMNVLYPMIVQRVDYGIHSKSTLEFYDITSKDIK